jgi:cobalamin biosynthesis Co2+ chelatase CbiK
LKQLEKEGWTQTDGSEETYQIGRKVSDGVYEFKEIRIIQPVTKEAKIYEAEIDLSEYSAQEKVSALESYGYNHNSFDKYSEFRWITAECLFELSED